VVRGAAVGIGDIHKIYTESVRDMAHLDVLVHEAQKLVDVAVSGRA